MIVWTGYGLWALLLGCVSNMGTIIVFFIVFGDQGAKSRWKEMQFIGLSLSTMSVFVVGRALNWRSGLWNAKHTLYYVPMECWAIGWLLLTVYCAFRWGI